MSVLIGRFHPVFVHLPIGILLFAAFLYFASKKQRFAAVSTAVGPALAIGSLFSILSCITGYLLSISDAYNESIIFKHQWLGIATAITSITCYAAYQKKFKYAGVLMLVLTALIIVTGHNGGNLTHGEDYLTASLSNNKSDKKVIANINEAVVYKDVIEPILAAKCYSCHGDSKQKGKLRLDLPNYIMEGGEEGKVLTPFQTGSSELINRLLLPTSNEEHMPPKEKPQLTKDEVALLHWWIESGASFTELVKNTKQSSAVKRVLAAFSSGDATAAEQTQLPAQKVSAISSDLLLALTKEGVAVTPIIHGSNYVRANLIGVETLNTQTFQLLSKISDQLLQLNASYTTIKDEHLLALSNCKQIKQLALNGTSITNKGLASLTAFENLEILSITQTKVTAAGVNGLTALQKLKKVFLYGTSFSGAAIAQLKQKMPSLFIDTGGYKVPILVTDTTEAKAPAVKTN